MKLGHLGKRLNTDLKHHCLSPPVAVTSVASAATIAGPAVACYHDAGLSRLVCHSV